MKMRTLTFNYFVLELVVSLHKGLFILYIRMLLRGNAVRKVNRGRHVSLHVEDSLSSSLHALKKRY